MSLASTKENPPYVELGKLKFTSWGEDGQSFIGWVRERESEGRGKKRD